MRFVIYTLSSDDYGMNMQYITVLNTLEEALTLKDRLFCTGYYFYGDLFVGEDSVLDFCSQLQWDNICCIDSYPELKVILEEYNYFGTKYEL